MIVIFTVSTCRWVPFSSTIRVIGSWAISMRPAHQVNPIHHEFIRTSKNIALPKWVNLVEVWTSKFLEFVFKFHLLLMFHAEMSIPGLLVVSFGKFTINVSYKTGIHWPTHLESVKSCSLSIRVWSARIHVLVCRWQISLKRAEQVEDISRILLLITWKYYKKFKSKMHQKRIVSSPIWINKLLHSRTMFASTKFILWWSLRWIMAMLMLTFWKFCSRYVQSQWNHQVSIVSFRLAKCSTKKSTRNWWFHA